MMLAIYGVVAIVMSVMSPSSRFAIAQEGTANGMLPITPVELRVMTFNIWRGGELVDFGKIVEAIQQ